MHVSIRIKEHLDQSWQQWLEGLQIVHEPGGTSRLSGTLSDQAALYGVLSKIDRLSLTLLSLERSETRPNEGWWDLGAEEIARLKREPGRDIYVTGGARLARSLSQRGLIDEYNLTIHPILLGSGMPLFREPSEELALTLVGTIPFESGAIHLIYQKASTQQELRPDQQSVQ